ncbi:MAG TPA: TadE/TadG family type IV pilus assembly protein [Bryobacteraceae bacterium]|nr:TadE/TadG family type IV pilus assembly protein [Bryobacteraceae bacterium]
MKRWIAKVSGNRRGNAILEFAIGSGVLVAVFVGTFQFGFTFLQYNNLENAVARGARYASLVPYDSATTAPSVAFQTAVQNMVLYGSPTTGTTPVLPGLTTGNANLSVTFTDGVPSAMTVSISDYTINSVFATTTLTKKPQVTYAYQGIWSPV